jgi:hypothetical protein
VVEESDAQFSSTACGKLLADSTPRAEPDAERLSAGEQVA